MPTLLHIATHFAFADEETQYFCRLFYLTFKLRYDEKQTMSHEENISAIYTAELRKTPLLRKMQLAAWRKSSARG